MKAVSEKHNNELNAIKEALKTKCVKGVIISGEFVANTNQSKDYLAFVIFRIKSVNINGITHFRGLALDELHDTNKCVDFIIKEMKREFLVYDSLFICE